MRSLTSAIKLLFVVGFFFVQNVFAEQQGALAGAKCEPGSACNFTAQSNALPRYIVYYFHGERRCKTCRGIETNAERVIRLSFENELKAGKLEWRIVNFDEPNNKHFVSDFNLYSSSLVIVDTAVGTQTRSVTLEKVWPLAHSEGAFDRYVTEEVRKFIGPSDG